MRVSADDSRNKFREMKKPAEYMESHYDELLKTMYKIFRDTVRSLD